MEISNLSKKKLRYFSKSYHYLNSLFSQSPQQPPFTLFLHPKTLVSPKPSIYPILNSNRFHSKPTSHPPFSFIYSTGSSSVCSITNPSSQSLQSSHFYRYNAYTSPNLNIGLFKVNSHSCFRCFSVSSVTVSPLEKVGSRLPHATPKQVWEIIELIRGGENDLESKLNLMNVSLSIASVTATFRILNCEKVSALRFFHWIRQSQPEFYCNSDICSLVIDNCGRLDDFEAMLCLLNDFRLNRVCLTQKAFGFLPVMISSKASTKKSLWKVIDVLNRVGGSCQVSGVRALIEMLSCLGSFEMAQFVIKKTERKVSYYNILIREKCRRCDFKGARDMLDEMRQVGCDPNVQTYNYILSSLCKSDRTIEACEVVEEMLQRGCPPNALTFELFIYDLCRQAKLDTASEFLDRMASCGIEPRLTTHAAFIKGYFNSCQYEEAYSYVVASGEKYRCSSNMMYSLLASLHQKKGNLAIAQNILSEMIKKGLRPYFSVYMRVLKCLQKSGRTDLARDLNDRFSSLSLQSNTDIG